MFGLLLHVAPALVTPTSTLHVLVVIPFIFISLESIRILEVHQLLNLRLEPRFLKVLLEILSYSLASAHHTTSHNPKLGVKDLHQS